MNILIINHYAGSPKMGMEFRPYYFAQEWNKMGHKVDILAADYSHLRRVNPNVKRDFQEDIIDGIHYHWIKTGSYGGNGTKRAMTMFRFILKLWIHTTKIISEMDPDVVIASSTYPLDTYVGQKIRRISKKKVKLVHEVHDLWPISPIEIGGMSPKHPFIKVMQRGENSFCRNSDIVVSLLPAAKNYLCEHGLKEECFRHVPNGIVLQEWEHPKPLPKKILDVLEQARQEGKFIIGFFGSHTKSYALEYLIEAVKKIEEGNIFVAFIGNGTHKEELKRCAIGYDHCFSFFEPIPKECIPSVFEKIDASYIGAVDNSMFRFGICMNKLFDAMMGGRPVLYAVNAPNNYIKEYQCGISVKSQDVDALASGIKWLMKIPEKKRKEMGANGTTAVRNHFNYSLHARTFESILKGDE